MKIQNNFTEKQFVYDKPDIVERYSRDDQLQNAEITIKEILKPVLPQASMLDIGVGAGRTSLHFVDSVENYTGVDYAPQMVAAAASKKQWPPNAIFMQSDARDLAEFADNSFDFVLFSFNGIDYVNHEDRLKILAHIRRVTKSGGYFCFSTHNLIGMEAIFNVKLPRSFNMVKILKHFMHTKRLKNSNDADVIEKIKNCDYLQLNDGSENFELLTYHIKPSCQITQLQSLGHFENIRTFACSDGKELTNPDSTSSQKDPWIYYLCQITK